MSFDALTIGGMLAALVSGGFLVGVARHHGGRWAAAARRPRARIDEGTG